VQYWPRVSYAFDAGVLVGFELQLLVALLPYEIGGAIAGYFGAAVRARLVRPRPVSPASAEPHSPSS